MTRVDLAGVWLNNAATPGDAVMLDCPAPEDTPNTGGGAQTFGGGRRRWIATEGTDRVITLPTIDPVDASTLAWLEAHKGVLCLLRDPTGRRRWGLYPTFRAVPYITGTYHVVTGLTFTELTHAEVS